MAFENISTDDFFPLFKQTLADSFKVDSFFMHAPYHDFEKMDMGLRRMVWGEYSTNSPIFSIAEDSPYRIVVLESTLGFYNMIISLTADEEPDLIGIMPFGLGPINQANTTASGKKTALLPAYLDHVPLLSVPAGRRVERSDLDHRASGNVLFSCLRGSPCRICQLQIRKARPQSQRRTLS